MIEKSNGENAIRMPLDNVTSSPDFSVQDILFGFQVTYTVIHIISSRDFSLHATFVAIWFGDVHISDQLLVGNGMGVIATFHTRFK